MTRIQMNDWIREWQRTGRSWDIRGMADLIDVLIEERERPKPVEVKAKETYPELIVRLS